MPIQIIDNFELGASKPIDNRFVVGAIDSFYADKNDIPYKYTGLRIWDLSGGAPGVGYVWDGTTWQGEAAGSVTSVGNPGYISKFLSPSSTIDDSIIYETAGKIGILTIAPDKTLTVNGAIKTIGTPPTGGFYGNGANITNINASYITTGNLSVNRIAPGTLNFILTTGGSGTEWTDPSTITVGKATDADKVYYQSSSDSNFLPIMFSESSGASGYHALRQSIANLAIKPSDGTIRMSPGSGTVNIGTVASNTSYKLWVVGGSSYGLLVDNFARFNSGVGIADPGSSLYALRIGSYGSVYPLRVESVSGSSGYFAGAIGIGGSPQSDYKLYVGSTGGKSLRTTGGVGIRTLPIHDGTDGYWPLRVAKISSNGTDSKGQRDGRCAYFYGTTFFGSDSDTGSNGVLQITSVNDTNQIDGASFKAVNDTNHIINFVNSVGTNRGKIRGNGASGVLYDTSSDRRLKKDIVDIGSVIEKIKLIKPSKFTWKEDNKEGFGFIAQDLFSIIPELRPDISTYCDINSKNFDIDNPIDRNGNPYYYGIDYGTLTPYLTKALQELIDKIKNADSLEELKNSL